MESNSDLPKNNLISDIMELQHQLNKYLDIKASFKLGNIPQQEFDIARYQKLSDSSLLLIKQSLEEQLQYYYEADENPIDIKKPKNMAANVFFDIFLQSDLATIIENDQNQTILINQKACNLFGYSAQEFLKLHPPDLQYITKEREIVPIYNDDKLNRFTTYETHFKRKNGSIFPGEMRLIRLEYNMSVYFIAMITDITKRREAEAKQQALINELQQAVTKIRKLKGLIPICGMCKKIRSDDGYWNQIDTFVQDMTEASFSHELCDDCKKKNWRLILSYFDSFFGPIILHNTPKKEIEEDIQELPLQLDYEKRGFFEITIGKIRILNRQYKIPSLNARGQHELIMISFGVVDGGKLNMKIGEQIIEELYQRMLAIDRIELVFSNQYQKLPEGMEKYKQIEEIFQETYNSIEGKLEKFVNK